MQYLFFDIECSVVNKSVAKICAFGYVRTNERFEILEKEDILINPKGGFHLTDRKGERGLVLPYEYGEFKNYPTFPSVKDKIYSLIEAKDTLVVGHATQNDVKYLNLEGQRFSLRPLRFSFLDTQFLYMNMIGDFSRQYGLSLIASDLGVEFTPHRAVDDAYATMRVAEAMCKRTDKSLKELCKEYRITLGKTDNFSISRITSVARENYEKGVAEKKRKRERAVKKFHIGMAKTVRYRKKDGKWNGKYVCFSHTIEYREKHDPALFQKLASLGGIYTSHASGCDVFVCADDEKETALSRSVAETARIVSESEFLKVPEA